MNHDKNIVKKPWGHEYLAYENENVAIWFLNIKKNQSTSMHCHPTKTTGLVLLDGIAEISFLSDKKILKGLDKVMIRRGLFHSTKSLSDSSLILEIETPKDKLDLVRLFDNYGREMEPYEDHRFEYPKEENCLWIEEPVFPNINSYQIGNCTISAEFIKDPEFFNSKKDTDMIMFLKGGLVRKIEDRNHLVTIPGDVGFIRIIKQISSQLDGVSEETLVLVIRKNDE